MNFHTIVNKNEDDGNDSSDDGQQIKLADGLSAETLAALLQFVVKTNNGTAATAEEDEDEDEDEGNQSDKGINNKNNKEGSTHNTRKSDSASCSIDKRKEYLDHDVNAMAKKIEESLGAKPDPERICDPLLATAAVSDAVEVLLRDGVVRLDNILPASLCDQCVVEIDERLQSARIAGTDYYTNGVNTFFGNVDANSNRWDMFLPDTGAFHDSMRSMFQTNKATQTTTAEATGSGEKVTADGVSTDTTLASIFHSVFKGEDASFYEYAALVSDGGATSQRIHSDTTYQSVCPVYTIFIALQDVTAELGPTVFIPGSNCEDSHKAFRFRKHAMLTEAKYKHALLNKGDIVVMDSRTFHCGSANTSAANPSIATVSSSGGTATTSTASVAAVNTTAVIGGGGSGSGGAGAGAADSAVLEKKYSGRRSLLYFSLLSPNTADMGQGSMLKQLKPTLHQMTKGGGVGGGDGDKNCTSSSMR